MRIALTADPEIPVPPTLYGGIERIIDILISGLMADGHEVTLFAHPESQVPCKLIAWPGRSSGGFVNQFRNTQMLFQKTLECKFDLVHSFSRLAYLMPLLPAAIPKVMSYQREPTISQVRKARMLARKGSLLFTGCSNYITNKISAHAPAATVYNCAPIDQYQLQQSVAADAPLVFLGRIEAIKGTHTAIEIARRSGRRLVIAGNIPAYAQAFFDEQVKPFLDEQILYVGPVNDQQKNELLGSAAAFLMPIHWNEPFGIVMAEAMACGTPVIGFPMGSVPEVVTDGKTGFICNSVEEVLARLPQLHTIDRSAVWADAAARFSNKVMVQHYLDIYRKMIQFSKKELAV